MKSATRLLVILFLFLLPACSPVLPASSGTKPEAVLSNTENTWIVSPTPTIQATATEIIEPTEAPKTLWISPAVPSHLKEQIVLPDGMSEVSKNEDANLYLAVSTGTNPSITSSQWVYALVVPFPTVEDGITFTDLKDLWQGTSNRPSLPTHLLVSPDTYTAFQALWGTPSELIVEKLDQAKVSPVAWDRKDTWAIIPFEDLEPTWKVLRVDGQSPVDRGFDPAKYPLAVQFSLLGANVESSGIQIPATNRDPDKLTTLIVTGTTALVRHTALIMEEQGVDFPAQDIGSLLREADITHISNEVPFYSKCPPAVPLRVEMRFCSDPKYYELLEQVGADVIELTGNHELDWGVEAIEETLSMYRQHELPYYGGGENLQEAVKPLVIEDHGNRLGFIGCNAAGPDINWATNSQPGTAPCDLVAIEQQITEWRAEGVIPIITFQHYEVDDYKPTSAQRVDFLRIADAGAAIISGSQAHFPQTMTFEHGAFVHYGLGNLFFDQMDPLHRRSFMDRHIFYDGRYISTELITTELEDYARPRLMTPSERKPFLEEIFRQSGWR